MPVCSRLVLVLDSSGSMNSQKSDIIGGVNETIRQQRQTNPKENAEVNFNVIKFSNEVSSPTNNTLENVPFLTNRDYVPGGTTALYDAIGLTIERYKDEDNVICIIATDGEENASRHFTYPQITNAIKKMKDTKGWNFIYLSENLDTFKQGEAIGCSSKGYNCNNVLTGRNQIGSFLGNANCQSAISQMRKGDKNVKIQTTTTTTTTTKTIPLNRADSGLAPVPGPAGNLHPFFPFALWK